MTLWKKARAYAYAFQETTQYICMQIVNMTVEFQFDVCCIYFIVFYL